MDNKRDSTFYLELDETPKTMGCLIHSHIGSEKTFSLGPQGKFGGVHYGLCTQCIEMLEFNPNYIDVVEEEITIRLNKLTSNGEADNNGE